jgi:hypothetical protein
VRITLDGPTPGTIRRRWPDHRNLGAPIDGQNGAASIWVNTAGGTAPRPHTVREADQTLFSIGDVYTLAQIGATATSSDDGEQEYGLGVAETVLFGNQGRRLQCQGRK